LIPVFGIGNVQAKHKNGASAVVCQIGTTSMRMPGSGLRPQLEVIGYKLLVISMRAAHLP